MLNELRDQVERPILFSTPMVQAILKKIKKMTRRVAKGIPKKVHRVESNGDGTFELFWGGFMPDVPGFVDGSITIKCPHGKPGDILWVRETWQKSECFDFGVKDQFVFKADGNNAEFADDHKIKWRPSIFMPREACRILLRITDIRVERLQDITEEDAKAEGVFPFLPRFPEGSQNYRKSFEILWDEINSKRGHEWKKNKWVWVVSFERI